MAAHGDLKTRAVDGERLPVVEFAFPGALRDELVAAILRGDKTSTTGLLVDFEREGETVPRVGERFAVIDSDLRAVAVIETTEVRVVPCGEVDEAFARDEGEGFETVAAWRAAHERFWGGYIEELRAYLGDPDWQVTDATLVVAERFRLVRVLEPPVRDP